MKKQEAAIYTEDKIHDEAPQNIISYFLKFSRLMQNEPIVAIFGSACEDSNIVENSAVILKDRIEYVETLRLFPKMKTVSFEYLDQIYLLSEGTLKYVSVVDITKSSTRFEIRSSVTDTTAFYNIIKEIKDGNNKKDKPIKTVKCTNCGASCTVRIGEETKCEYCDTTIVG